MVMLNRLIDALLLVLIWFGISGEDEPDATEEGACVPQVRTQVCGGALPVVLSAEATTATAGEVAGV